MIMTLTTEKARKAGIKHRSTLKRMKYRIMKDNKINLDTREVKEAFKSHLK